MLNVVQGYNAKTISLVCTKILTTMHYFCHNKVNHFWEMESDFDMLTAIKLSAPQCLDHSPALLVELSVVILLKYVCLLRLLRVIQLPQQDNSI